MNDKVVCVWSQNDGCQETECRADCEEFLSIEDFERLIYESEDKSGN